MCIRDRAEACQKSIYIATGHLETELSGGGFLEMVCFIDDQMLVVGKDSVIQREVGQQ